MLQDQALPISPAETVSATNHSKASEQQTLNRARDNRVLIANERQSHLLTPLLTFSANSAQISLYLRPKRLCKLFGVMGELFCP